MTAIKDTVDDGSPENGHVRYHIANPVGEHYEMRLESNGGTLTGNLVIGSSSNFVVLSQSNVSDLATAFSNFGSTGTLTCARRSGSFFGVGRLASA